MAYIFLPNIETIAYGCLYRDNARNKCVILVIDEIAVKTTGNTCKPLPVVPHHRESEAIRKSKRSAVKRTVYIATP